MTKVRGWVSLRVKLCIAKTHQADAQEISSELLGSFEEAWRKHYPDSDVVLVADVKQALTTARNLSEDAGISTQTLITGSQLLVGGALLALNGGTVT